MDTRQHALMRAYVLAADAADRAHGTDRADAAEARLVEARHALHDSGCTWTLGEVRTYIEGYAVGYRIGARTRETP
jgi:hypothetical protein